MELQRDGSLGSSGGGQGFPFWGKAAGVLGSGGADGIDTGDGDGKNHRINAIESLRRLLFICGHLCVRVTGYPVNIRSFACHFIIRESQGKVFVLLEFKTMILGA